MVENIRRGQRKDGGKVINLYEKRIKEKTLRSEGRGQKLCQKDETSCQDIEILHYEGIQVKKAVIDQVERICRKVENCNSCKKNETASSLRQYCYISEGFYGLNFTSKTDFQPTAQKLLPENLFPLFLPFALTFFNKQTKLRIYLP